MFWPSFKLPKGLRAFKIISFSREFVPFDLTDLFCFKFLISPRKRAIIEFQHSHLYHRAHLLDEEDIIRSTNQINTTVFRSANHKAATQVDKIGMSFTSLIDRLTIGWLSLRNSALISKDFCSSSVAFLYWCWSLDKHINNIWVKCDNDDSTCILEVLINIIFSWDGM